MPRIPRQDRETRIADRRRDEDIGETGREAGCPCGIGQPPGEPSHLRGYRQDAIAIKMEHALKPCRKLRGLFGTPLPRGFRDAVFDFRDGDGGQEQRRGLGFKPIPNVFVLYGDDGGERGYDIRVNQIHWR